MLITPQWEDGHLKEYKKNCKIVFCYVPIAIEKYMKNLD